MTDPLALVTLAVAAAGGRMAGHDNNSLIAAGHTLLQRSAVLVRALTTLRSAVWLPTGGPWLTALAASDGRGALLLDPQLSGIAVADRCAREGVGALFTVAPLARAADTALASELIQIWLDDAPVSAAVISRDGDRRVERRIDLGAHFGIDLAGDTATEGRDEPFVHVDGGWHTHRALLAAARTHAAVQGLTPVHWMPPTSHWTLDGLVHQVGMLLQGGTITHGDAPAA